MPKSPVIKRLSNLFTFRSDPRSSRRKSLEKSSNSINNLLAYYESNSANGGAGGASLSNDRLNATSSPDSGVLVVKPRRPHQRTLSAGSTSSSDYSVESNSVDEHFSITSGDLDDAKSTYTSTTTSTNRTSTTHKRSNMPSVGGADRRRLAIVQMESLQEAMSASGTSSSESSLRSRRGISTNLAGLALVAPPDASSKTYTHLSPPNTATTSVAGGTEEKDKDGDRKHGQGHHRREGQHTPRDRGTEDKNSLADNKTTYHYERARRSPSPTKLTHPATTTTTTRPIPNPYEAQRAMLSPTSARGIDGHSALSSAFPSSTLPTPLITPDIGAGKEIHVPVAAPVVVNLAASAAQPRPPILRNTTVAIPPVQSPVHGVTATAVFDPLKTSGFVNYKPGASTLFLVSCLTSKLILNPSANHYRSARDRWPSSSSSTTHRHNFGFAHPSSPTTAPAAFACTPKAPHRAGSYEASASTPACRCCQAG